MLNYCLIVLVKIAHVCVALNPNSPLLLNQCLALIHFSYAQQDHKINGIGITPNRLIN